MHLKQLVSLTLFLAAPVALLAADDAKPVTLQATPPAVQKAIAAQIGDGKLGDIERSDGKGDTTFDVSFTTKAGDERGFSVADDGTLLSIEVTLAEAPAPVQKTIQAQATGWELEGIDKNVEDAEISYDVEVSKGGVDKSFTIADDGDLLGAEVSLAETPAPVQATIKTLVADGSLKSIEENFDSDGNSFDVTTVTKDGGEKSFTVAADGKVLSEEVALEAINPGARATITEKIGDGKILRIDKSLSEKKDKVFPYEVEGRKDGKPFDFSVGPKGKFLGMDE